MKISIIHLKNWMLICMIMVLLSLSSMASPGLNLTKNCNTISANINDNITYIFDLKNNGTERLSNPTLWDDHLGDIQINKSVLEAGESFTVRVLYRIQESDLPGPLVNIANARAEYMGGKVLSNNASYAVSLGVIGYENLTKYGYPLPELINSSVQ